MMMMMMMMINSYLYILIYFELRLKKLLVAKKAFNTRVIGLIWCGFMSYQQL